MGIWRDDAAEVTAKLKAAAARYDVLLTTGGASRGEEDHLIDALDTLGTRHLWQLAIKPGRPMSMGQIGDCVVLGLPGNPVAVMVCFLLYVYPSLMCLGGGGFAAPDTLTLPAGFARPKRKTGRREFLRGWIEQRPTGPHLVAFERDGSGLISGLRQATGLIEVAEDLEAIDEGSPLPFIPFAQFGV